MRLTVTKQWQQMKIVKRKQWSGVKELSAKHSAMRKISMTIMNREKSDLAVRYEKESGHDYSAQIEENYRKSVEVAESAAHQLDVPDAISELKTGLPPLQSQEGRR